jgi:hypothetical protein
VAVVFGHFDIGEKITIYYFVIKGFSKGIHLKILIKIRSLPQ